MEISNVPFLDTLSIFWKFGTMEIGSENPDEHYIVAFYTCFIITHFETAYINIIILT